MLPEIGSLPSCCAFRPNVDVYLKKRLCCNASVNTPIIKHSWPGFYWFSGPLEVLQFLELLNSSSVFATHAIGDCVPLAAKIFWPFVKVKRKLPSRISN